MLVIEDLHVSVEGKAVLKGLSLSIQAGEVHALMGPNGSGKSTLSKVVAGHPAYEVVSGSIRFEGQDLLAMSVSERAAAGIFLGFQDPVEVPGVNNLYFLRAALNAQRKSRGEAEIDSPSFLRMARAQADKVGLSEGLMKRMLNAGFSGGEKKRNEMLQLALLQPKLAVLDEIDSGLDIDALQAVAATGESLKEAGRAFVLVTHYQRLLELFRPDKVHVLKEGRIVRSGGMELVAQLEADGYQGVDTAVSGAA